MFIFISGVISQNPGDNLFLSPVIHTVHIHFSQPSWYDSLIAYKPLDKKMMGDVEIDGVMIYSVGVQFKGNSSFNNPSQKKSWKIDFNEYVSGQKYDGVKGIHLNNVFKDPSFLREKLGLDYCLKNNIPAPRCTYANVYVNNTLWGFYTLVEKVDKTFLSNRFPENDGNLFKGDPNGLLQWLGSNPSGYYSKYELKTNETVNDWSDLVHLIDVINNKPPSQFYDSLQSVLNTQLAIKAWAFDILFSNLDSYRGSGHNYYIYHNLFSNKFEWIEWDVNEVFGNFTMNGMNISQMENLSIFYIPSPSSSRPLVNNMLQNTTFKSQYINTLCNMVFSDFDTGYFYKRIDSLANKIRPYVYADTKKFFTNSQFETNINSNVSAGFQIPGIKSFILNRRNSVISQLASLGCVQNIHDYPNQFEVKVFPNPCSSDVCFDFSNSNNIPSQGIIVLSDLTGNKVYEYNFILDNFSGTVRADIRNVNEGFYFYSVLDKNYQLLFKGKLLVLR
jgi:spore coat protein CotH